MNTPPTKRHLQTALALTLLACSGLSGCSEGQEQNASSSASSAKAAVVTATPKASGTPTTTGTPSATASPTITMTPELEASKKRALATPPPPKPELITVNNDDGAIATAKYWVQLHFYIYTTGQTSEYKELCPGNNKGCVGAISDVLGNHAAGGWMDPVTPRFITASLRLDLSTDTTTVVQLTYEHDSFVQYDGTGRIINFPNGSRYAIIEMHFVNGEWKVLKHEDEVYK
ncbi:MAG: hypothetical protein KH264_08745 [Actinomyces graevenitzii]|nr:hypothetical protein [Actinomyces graevenitzii]